MKSLVTVLSAVALMVLGGCGGGGGGSGGGGPVPQPVAPIVVTSLEDPVTPPQGVVTQANHWEAQEERRQHGKSLSQAPQDVIPTSQSVISNANHWEAQEERKQHGKSLSQAPQGVVTQANHWEAQEERKQHGKRLSQAPQGVISTSQSVISPASRNIRAAGGEGHGEHRAVPGVLKKAH